MARKGININSIKDSTNLEYDDKLLIENKKNQSLSVTVGQLKDKILNNTISDEMINNAISDSIKQIPTGYDSNNLLNIRGVRTLSDNLLNYINNNFMISTNKICNDTLIKNYDINLAGNSNESSKIKSLTLTNLSKLAFSPSNIKELDTSDTYHNIGCTLLSDVNYTIEFTCSSRIAIDNAFRILSMKSQELIAGISVSECEQNTTYYLSFRTKDSDLIISIHNDISTSNIIFYANYDDTYKNINSKDEFVKAIKSNHTFNVYYKNMINPISLPTNKYYDFENSTYKIVEHSITDMDGEVPKNAQVLQIPLETDKYYTLSGIPSNRDSNYVYIVNTSPDGTLNIYKKIDIPKNGIVQFYSSDKYYAPELYFILYNGEQGAMELCRTMQLEEGQEVTEFCNYKDKSWQMNKSISVNETEFDGSYKTLFKLYSIGNIRDELYTSGKIINRIGVIDYDSIKTNKIAISEVSIDGFDDNYKEYQFDVDDPPSYVSENGLINIISYSGLGGNVCLPKQLDHYTEGLYIIANKITLVLNKNININDYMQSHTILYKKYMKNEYNGANSIEISSEIRKIIVSKELLPVICNYLSPYVDSLSINGKVPSVEEIIKSTNEISNIGFVDYSVFISVIRYLVEQINLLNARIAYLEEYAVLIPEHEYR